MMNKRITFILLSVLFLGTVSVFAGNIFVNEDGIQADNYYSGEGNEGISFNMTLEELVDNDYRMIVENGLIVNITNATSQGNETSDFPSEGLIAYYKLDETSGTTASDELGSYDGTNNGADVGVTGKINTAYDFEKSEDDYISLPSSIGTALSNTELTINLWIKPEQEFNSAIGITTLFDSQGTNRILIDYDSYANGGIRAYYGVNTPYTTTFSADTWYMITFVVTDGTNYLYINGSEVATISNSGLVSIGTATTIIGENYAISSGRGMDGLIDEVYIASRALNSTEVSELYNSGSGLSYS